MCQKGDLGALGHKPKDWALKGTWGCHQSMRLGSGGEWGPEVEGAGLSLLASSDCHSQSFLCQHMSEALLSTQLL